MENKKQKFKKHANPALKDGVCACPLDQTICLNMIVKDESHVIARCLSSVKHLIDYWVIVDTGSTDGTQSAIRAFMQEIRGELHERPWVNFGYNRNEALRLARGKADYILFIDADDRMIYADSFSMPHLVRDYYYVFQKVQNTYNQRVFLIKDLPDFAWEGAVHERLICDPARSFAFIEGAFNEYIHDGNRSKDPKRFENDRKMLEESIAKEPISSRDVFYLAQTYRGLEDYEAALVCYKKRVELGGEEDETFYSLFCIACLQEMLHYSQEVYIKTFCDAYLFRPSRAESLFQMTAHLLQKGQTFLGYLVAKFASKIPKPSPLDLFQEPWVYECGIKSQLQNAKNHLLKHDC